jgi:CrcB protein
LLENLRKPRFALADDFRGCSLEQVVGWDAVEPLLLGQFFVSGEIEAYEKLHGPVFPAGGSGGFWLRFGLRLLCFFGRLFGFGCFRAKVFATIKLYLQLFIEAKRLFPSFKLVARLLGFLFVGAKIEQHIRVGHKESLRCAWLQVKIPVALARPLEALTDPAACPGSWTRPERKLDYGLRTSPVGGYCEVETSRLNCRRNTIFEAMGFALTQVRVGGTFPYGTLLINLTGCFFLGLIGQFTLNRMVIPPDWRVAITVGFFGGFTTFSSFGWETAKMLEDGEWLSATSYVVASVAAGLFLSVAGIRLANRF